eukprot:gene9123-16246_t
MPGPPPVPGLHSSSLHSLHGPASMPGSAGNVSQEPVSAAASGPSLTGGSVTDESNKNNDADGRHNNEAGGSNNGDLGGRHGNNVGGSRNNDAGGKHTKNSGRHLHRGPDQVVLLSGRRYCGKDFVAQVGIVILTFRHLTTESDRFTIINRGKYIGVVAMLEPDVSQALPGARWDLWLSNDAEGLEHVQQWVMQQLLPTLTRHGCGDCGGSSDGQLQELARLVQSRPDFPQPDMTFHDFVGLVEQLRA